jgi:hypothetical protein
MKISVVSRRAETMKYKLYSIVVAGAVTLLGVGLAQSADAPKASTSQTETPVTTITTNEIKSRLVGDWETHGKIWTFTDTTVAISGGPGMGADATPYQVNANTVSFTVNGTRHVALVIEAITGKEMTVTLDGQEVVFKRVE